MPAAEPSPSAANDPTESSEPTEAAEATASAPAASRSRTRRIVRNVFISFAAVIVLAVVGMLVWANVGVMQAEPDPLESVRSNPAVHITENSNSFILTPTGDATGEGLLFIPGAKVSADAYLYKLSGAVAESGLTVVVTKPILNLAFFDQRSLDTFTSAVPDVDSWFVGGHSLGGVRACQYAEQPDVNGLVLFGSYCANDLSEVDTRVLSLSGSNDLLSTPEKIMNAAHLLPTSTTFFPIDGANHASFGDYGVQAGDGEATLNTSVVRDVIAAEINSFVRNG
ncbi:alpha/beta hydrolase family protein [Salinibacterium amurskyense]|uniref:Alpha/beta hydrolase family protein n=1 Tax=Salinibacterium amurskyense TaxID=205941 RepID=A0A2M9DA56_9MICO|nr:alpha/beta hydrolase [Salinibacterium amurskyense]PJJ82552.1 alpha/beta hydrolase family protein [Salinibacterium amurskyense]RLQ82292.1 alpha/beta hydrolase [Salinibacterium amurskyense]GHD76547.1 alpha/beta hydrolase [Salinibacterium amurskyense]